MKSGGGGKYGAGPPFFPECSYARVTYIFNVNSLALKDILCDQHWHVSIRSKYSYHISRRLTGFGQMTILNTRAVINISYWKLEVNNTLVLLTCICSKAFHSVLKHAYHPIGIQYTRYNNFSCAASQYQYGICTILTHPYKWSGLQ